jgi:Mrp family chromosome partitioning ATPase/capsular polysaccharide biosynthesis protein
MGTRTLLRSLRRRLVIAALVMLVVLAAGVAALDSQRAQYRATGSIVLLPNSANVASGPLFGQGLPGFLATYAQLSTGTPYREAVARASGLTVPEVRRDVSVGPGASGAVLNVSATTGDRETSLATANAAVAALATRIERASGTSSSTALVKIRVTPASLPGAAIGPSRAVTLAGLVLVAIISGALAAIGFDQLFRRVTDPDDAAEITGIPTVGVLPKARPKARGRPAVAVGEQADPLLAACARDLRSNLMFGMEPGKGWRTIAVIGLTPKAGVTTAVVNLALAIDELGESVAVVDATERGDASAVFEAADSTIPCFGGQPVNGTATTLFQELAGVAVERYERIIVDPPSAIESPLTRVLASRVDTVVVAVPAGAMYPKQLRRSLENLRMVGANIAGVVLTRTTRRAARRWSTTGPSAQSFPTPQGSHSDDGMSGWGRNRVASSPMLRERAVGVEQRTGNQ